MLFQFGQNSLRTRRRYRRRDNLLERAPRRACEERPGEQHRDRQRKRPFKVR